MNLNTLEFLEEEREAWRPYEAMGHYASDAADLAAILAASE